VGGSPPTTPGGSGGPGVLGVPPIPRGSLVVSQTPPAPGGRSLEPYRTPRASGGVQGGLTCHMDHTHPSWLALPVAGACT